MLGKLGESLGRVYDKHYKTLLIFPMLLVVFAIAIISMNYASTGEFFEKDVSLKGGITVTILSTQQAGNEQLASSLSQELGLDISVRSLSSVGASSGLIVESEGTQEDVARLLSAVEKKLGKLDEQNYTVQVIGSSLSESFLKEAVVALLIAFLMMGITVIIYFRALIPSLIVIWAVFSDFLCTFAVIILIQEKLSTAGLAAFLMLIGYSVDTDLLLTTRVLKGTTGTVYQRTIGAMKTGIFMTLTALAATTVGLFFSQSDTIRQIMLVLSIGLVFDMIHTWFTNAGILRWYLERKHKGVAHVKV